MNKAIFGSALFCTAFLILGTYVFPSDVVMWFAGTSLAYTLFRIVMIMMLIAVLVTNPPRHLYMRIAMGAMACTMACLGVGLLFASTLHLLDATLFMTLAAAFGLEALEFNQEELEEEVAALREKYVEEHPVPAVQQFKAITSRALVDPH